ncbi:CUB domain-containing protein [Vicugna pacos]|uniref:CUB domain-containing protein n=1 Tax=Vicugna pacos TaxID=30538 RepID=A0ABM5E4T2_VICPA
MELSRAIPWALLLSTATAISNDWYPRHRDCGGVIKTEYGIIATYYGPNTECVWTIEMDPEFQVAVDIPHLRLTCNKEYVEILDGPPESNSYGKICKGLNLEYRSSSNVMTVKYSRQLDHPASSYEIIFFKNPQG